MKNSTTIRTSPFNSPNNSGTPSLLLRNNMVVFSGNSNKSLAEEISDILNIKLGEIKVGRFNDG